MERNDFELTARIYPEKLSWPECIVIYRMRLGLTKAQLADVCKWLGNSITRTTVWRIETGNARPNAKTRQVLEDAIAFLNSQPHRDVEIPWGGESELVAGSDAVGADATAPV